MPDLADTQDIRDTLAAELEKASAAPADAPPVETVEAPPVEEAEAVAPPESASDRRERDEKGRFAAKEAAEAKQAEEAAQKPAKSAQPAEAEAQQPAEKSVAPPPGWSPASKAAWHEGKLPLSVIKDVAQREQQISAGLAKLASFKPLEPYVEMARTHNTTLPEALERYVAAEQQLERNPEQGLMWLAQNYGVDLRALAAKMGPQDQIPQPQPQGMPDLGPVLSPIQKELAQLREIVYGDKQAQTKSQVEQFFADPQNRYAENVADQMSALIKTGQAKTLKEAYDTACWMNAEVRTELIREQQTAQQAQQAAKAKEAAANAKRSARSITGGPAATPPATLNGQDDLRSQLTELMSGARA